KHWWSDTNYFQPGYEQSLGAAKPNARYLVGDLNGDRQSDLVVIWKNEQGQAVATVWRAEISDSATANLVFRWVQGPDQILGQWNDNATYRLNDQNKDGRTDLIGAWTDADGKVVLQTWLSDGISVSTAGNWGKDAQYLDGDFNGDGRLDLLEIRHRGDGQAEARQWIATDTGYSAGTVSVLGSWRADSNWLVGDVTGDGKADLVEIRRETDAKVTATTWLMTEAGLIHGETTDISANNPYRARYYLTELSGDGKADLVVQWDNAGTTFHTEWTVNGRGFVRAQESRSWGAQENHLQTLALDNNADGRQDVARFFKYNNELWVGVNQRTAGGLNNYSEMKLDSWNETSRFFAADVNGDGKQDLIQVYTGVDSNTHVRHWVSNGSLFTAGQDVSIGEARPGARFLVGDLNADGKPDLLQIWQSTDNKAMAQILRATATGYSGVSSSTLGDWREGASYRLVRHNNDNRPDLIASWQDADGRWNSTTWRQQAMPNRFVVASTQTSAAGDAFQSTAAQFATSNQDGFGSSANAFASVTKDNFGSTTHAFAAVTADAFGTSVAQFTAAVRDVFGSKAQQFAVIAAESFGSTTVASEVRDIRFATTNNHDANPAGFDSAWHVGNPVADGLLGSEQTTQAGNRPVVDDSSLDAVKARVALAQRSVGIQHLFDEAGREVFTLSVDGLLTERQFDSAGNLLRESRYATPMVSNTALTLAEVRARLAVLPKTAMDQHSYIVRDALGREAYRIGADRSVSSIDYDKAGRITRRTRFAQSLPGSVDLGQPLTLDGIQQAMAGGDHSHDQIERLGYDAASRPVYAIDGVGHVNERRFDGAGNEIGRRILLGRTDLAVWDAEQRLTIDTSQTVQHSRAFYDAASQLIIELDGEGYATRRIYDSNGQLIQRIRYGTALTVADNADLAIILSKLPVTPDSKLDSVERYVYDTAGRLAITIDGAGRVRRSVYDGMGRVVRTIQYAKTLTAQATLADFGKPGAADRVTDVVYDNLGRARFTIDPEGVVAEQQYNYLGQVTQSIRHEQRITTRPYDSVALTRYGNLDETGTMHDPVSMFSRTTSQGEVWQYGYAAAAGAFTAFPVLTSKQGVDYWGTSSNGTPGVFVNPTDARVTFGTNWVDGRQVMLHPGSGTTDRYAVLRFVAPQSGSYRLDAMFQSNDSYGATTDVHVLINGQEIFAGNVSSTFRPQLSQAIVVKQGDTIDFMVGTGVNGTYSYDSTSVVVALHQSDLPVVLGQGDVDSLAVLEQLQETYKTPAAQADKSQRFYDKGGRVSFAVDPEGRVTHFRYDSFGRLTGSIVHADLLTDLPPTLAKLEAAFANADSTDRVSSAVYDVVGREIYRIDTQGQVVAKRYNSLGQRVEQIEYARAIPAGVALDEATVTAALLPGNEDRHTLYRYDNAGRLVEQTNALNKTERLAYDAAGQLISRTDALNHQWQKRYDQRGMLVEELNDAGERTRYGYNAAGQRNSVTDANTNVVSSRYDGAGQLVETLDANNKAEQYRYDTFGNRIETKDRLGFTTRVEYDKANRVIKKLDAQNHFTVNRYDDRGNLVMQQVDLGRGSDATVPLANGGFETVNANGSYIQRPADGAWLYENSAGISAATGSGFTNGAPAPVQGSQVGFIQGDGRISQTIQVSTGVALYFKATQRVNANSLDQRLQVLVDGIPQGEPIVPPRGRYGEFVVPLAIMTAGSHTVTIQGLGGVAGGDVTAFVDDVKLDQGAVATTVNRYDRAGRLLASVNAEGEVTSYEYDTFGNRVASVRHAERVAVSADSLATLPTVDAADQATRYGYDRAGQLTSTTNALNQVSRNEYDG
uniref:FG-GAP-like repeat-containing protein n=1 Tax=Chitinivorax sp. B TaxID=2502235 RepID=UPI0010F7F4F6